MNPQDWDRCKQIFCDALEQSGEERRSLLDQECGADCGLRMEVEKMLAAAADDTSPLDHGAAERIVGNLKPAEPLIAGDVVGSYRVLRHIGQGGTSRVYLAEHTGLRSPRRFAIKVIASAFIAGQHERFDRECEILATFEHPNIARIIDKGVSESGWPYLVMDYIDGAPIQQYCSQKKLAPPEIVRLTLECCRAVEYIHRNSIVHCDLKPTNILVDATGSPMILDFGIARLIEPGDNTRKGGTTRGIRPLTPNYASPEQLAGRPLTTSTDVYSLGVVLYECLARSLPFDNSELPWTQISERIANQEPPPPSKARLKAGATREDAVFSRQVSGDLDSIVLKTLAHDPGQRYGSMDELSGDLKRYLAGEVVKARRSNVADRLRKLSNRHQRLVAEVLAATLSIALAIGASSWYAQRRQRDRENRHADEWGALVRHTLALPADVPDSALARGTLAERLSIAIESFSSQSSQYPGIVPDLADALVRTGDLLGNPYGVSLGRVDEARACYARALGFARGSPEARCADIRARACLGFGDTYSNPAVGRDPAEAARWYQRALSEISEKSAEFPETAAVAHGRMGLICELLGGARDAETEYGSALSLLPRDAGSTRPVDSALYIFRRAGMVSSQARGAAYADAIRSLDDVLAYSGNSRARRAAVDAHLSLGLAEIQASRLASAEREFANAAAMAEQILRRDPDDIPERRVLAIALRRRAMVAVMRGRIAESDALRDRANEALQSTMAIPVPGRPDAEANPSCSDSTERLSAGDFSTPLQPGNLLIGNRSGAGAQGRLLVFSPGSRELSVLADGGYLSDPVDVSAASHTEVYVVDRSLNGAGSIVRLRYDGGRWLQKPVTCGGLIRRPNAVAYHDGHLVLADADEYSTRLIAVDPATGRQALLGRTGPFTEPGKIVHSPAGDFYLSVYWPGEGGPAGILRFNFETRRFTAAARYGFLDDPVALAITSQGELIVGNRAWAGNGGHGDIFRIGRDGAQKLIRRSVELSRLTAIAVESEGAVWYATAAAPFTPAGLFETDLNTGRTEQIMSGETLAAPNALVKIN